MKRSNTIVYVIELSPDFSPENMDKIATFCKTATLSELSMIIQRGVWLLREGAELDLFLRYLDLCDEAGRTLPLDVPQEFWDSVSLIYVSFACLDILKKIPVYCL